MVDGIIFLQPGQQEKGDCTVKKGLLILILVSLAYFAGQGNVYAGNATQPLVSIAYTTNTQGQVKALHA